MSSTLDRMVPVLTGVNYLDWATRMSAYLEGKGLLGHALGKIPKPAIPQSPASIDEISAAVSALNYWAGNDGRVMGTIVLKTALHVRVHLEGEDSAQGYWAALRKAYYPRLFQICKPLDKLAAVQAPTKEEAKSAPRVITVKGKNPAPTVQLLSNKSSKPDVTRRQRSEPQSRNMRHKLKARTAINSAVTQKGNGASSMHQKHTEPSKLMVSPPSLGISIENKTKVLSTTNICRRGPDNFPKIAESSNLSDKLGIPVNTLRQSVMTLIEPRQGVSMSYKDALLIKAAPENPSAEVLILEWLQDLHPGYNSQES